MDKRELKASPDPYGLTRLHPYAYSSYSSMKARCLRKTHKAYKRYGARGIKVCDRWLNSFGAFLADMGERPDGCTLDRIENDGHYEPGNCRWATWGTQSTNRSSNRLITMQGKTQTLSEWAKEIGRSKGTISTRIKHGWPEEMIVSKASYKSGQGYLKRGGNKRVFL